MVRQQLVIRWIGADHWCVHRQEHGKQSEFSLRYTASPNPISTCIGMRAPAKSARNVTCTPSYSSSALIHSPATDSQSKRIPSSSSNPQIARMVVSTSRMAELPYPSKSKSFVGRGVWPVHSVNSVAPLIANLSRYGERPSRYKNR
jgi:hypothetical protein